MDKISESRLSEVCPMLADKIRTLADTLSQEGIEIRVVQGLRTWQEQDALYAKGRATPPIGKSYIVTNARGGQSYHNFGLAVDVVPFINGQPDWEVHETITNADGTHTKKMKDNWTKMIETGESIGLFSGHRFTTIDDCPHFQLTGKYPASPNAEALNILKSQGLQAIWDEAFQEV